MRIAIAQSRSTRGDIAANIAHHNIFVALAISHHADIIIFPELSLTGYEPDLAANLATTTIDPRLNELQALSNAATISIGVGIPLKAPNGTTISLAILHPNASPQTYHKHYLHADELPYFVSGTNTQKDATIKDNIALAICYELSVPAHSRNAADYGAKYYIASVAKSKEGVTKAHQTLSGIATLYGMTVLMANSVGPSDNFISAGNSAIWLPNGKQAAQLNETEEGILIFDTKNQEVIACNITG